MDLTSIQTLKDLLHKHNIRPAGRLGQNFLINKNALEKLVDAANITKGGVVVEVGAGLGTITIELARRAKRIIAVEKDKGLIPILKETTKEFSNVEIIEGDILKLTAYSLQSTAVSGQRLAVGYKLVGNIPYYLTAPLIRKFLEMDSSPKSMTLMIQKEMAQRITAKPPNMSILAVSVQFYAKPEIISYIPRSSFWPRPEVDSAIIKITPLRGKPPASDRDRNACPVPEQNDWFGGGTVPAIDTFFSIVKAGFSNPRKQIANNLSKRLEINIEETKKWLKRAGVDPKRRAETLSVEEWLMLTRKCVIIGLDGGGKKIPR